MVKRDLDNFSSAQPQTQAQEYAPRADDTLSPKKSVSDTPYAQPTFPAAPNPTFMDYGGKSGNVVEPNMRGLVDYSPQDPNVNPNPAAMLLPSMKNYPQQTLHLPGPSAFLPQIGNYGPPPPHQTHQILQPLSHLGVALHRLLFLQPAPTLLSADMKLGQKGRMRVSKACDRCRTQKIKCTGTYPCTTCVKHKKDCTFSHPQTLAGRPAEDVAADNSSDTYRVAEPTYHGDNRFVQLTSGLPIVRPEQTEYVSHLENRVQYLESLLLNDNRTNFRQQQYDDAEDDEVVKILTSLSSKWRYLRRHQNGLIIELCNAMYDTLSDESKSQVIVPRTQLFGWNMSGCNYLLSEALPSLPDIKLPQDNSFYIDYFFREINPLFAVLHETVFREQVEAYNKIFDDDAVHTKQSALERDAKRHQTKLFLAMLCLIYLLSIRFTEFQKPGGPSVEALHIEEKLFKYSHKVISILAFEWESIEIIQSLLLISLYLRITHRQTSSYMAMGHAITMTRSMGLAVDCKPMANMTDYERLKAKRVFWCVFSFDRLFGLQSGRYRGLNDEGIRRAYPSMDFDKEVEKDDWLTLPAFAMVHIARLANFVHTSTRDNYESVKFQQINLELLKLNLWMNENGFDNDADIFSDSGTPGQDAISSLVKVQVKLHFYDLIISIHGRVLFNFVGRRIANDALKLEMVVEASQSIIKLFNKVQAAGLLYSPWYIHMLLMMNVGVNALTMIHGGVRITESRHLIENSMRLLTELKNSPVRNEKGKIIHTERFNMVKECLWALKMCNHILALRLEECQKDLTRIGIDHGPSDVNKQVFNNFGYNKNDSDKNKRRKKLEENDDKFNQVFEQHRNRGEKSRSTATTPTTKNSTTPSSAGSSGKGQTNDLLGNLQWFDQWLDFNYDL